MKVAGAEWGPIRSGEIKDMSTLNMPEGTRLLAAIVPVTPDGRAVSCEPPMLVQQSTGREWTPMRSEVGIPYSYDENDTCISDLADEKDPESAQPFSLTVGFVVPGVSVSGVAAANSSVGAADGKRPAAGADEGRTKLFVGTAALSTNALRNVPGAQGCPVGAAANASANRTVSPTNPAAQAGATMAAGNPIAGNRTAVAVTPRRVSRSRSRPRARLNRLATVPTCHPSSVAASASVCP